MVNKCSVIGCMSLYSNSKDIIKIKLHRFPLTNLETLPRWVAITGRQSDWKPCKSSRLCSNHFETAEYLIGHGKGVLKQSAIPTIEYRVQSPRYNRKKYENYKQCNPKKTTKIMEVEPMAPESDINDEVVQLDDELDISDLKDEMTSQNSIENNETQTSSCDENNEQHPTNQLKGAQNDDYTNNSITIESERDEDNEETNKNEYDHDNSKVNAKNNIFNRDDQRYIFTSSFKEDVKPTNSSLNDQNEDPSIPGMNINQSTAEISFSKIMRLKKLKKLKRTKDIYSLYFKSLLKSNILGSENNENDLQSLNESTAAFGKFIEVQMRELRPYKRLYLSTKHKIQKILMRAQLKITA